ncbi:MAG: S8 family serine peptidase [Erysipelotrichales bacterium]|nr:S8 family serine peptidase [Erysipelotrichales bacterium]
MKNISINLKKITSVLLLIILTFLALKLFMSSIRNVLNSNENYTLRYYIRINNKTLATNSLDKFLNNASEDKQIEVVFELYDCKQTPENPAASLTMTSTINTVDAALAQHREKTREFHTSRNLSFLEENGLCFYSGNITISYFSPHITKAFANIDEFKDFSDNILEIHDNSVIKRVSVLEIVEPNSRAVREPHDNAPIYPMAQVRRDIGVNCNTFIGRGVTVGMIEANVPHDHAELNNVRIRRLGDNITGFHSTVVARTFVGSLSLAPGVSALNSYATAGAGFSSAHMISAMSWHLHYGSRIINISWGPNNTQYAWMDAFFDYHSMKNNVTIVAAIGNDGRNDNPNKRFAMTPALGFNVISVGSTNANGNVSSYSSFGTVPGLETRNPTLVAPGTWLETTWPGFEGNGHAGTSFSAPIVASIIARLMEEFPVLVARPDMVKAILIASAISVNGHIDGTFSNISGAGRIHYERAREAARNAVSFQNSIRNGVNEVRASHSINVMPYSRIRVAAFWQKNSAVYSANCQVHTNIHTNYDLRIRGTQAHDDHSSNIQVVWHNTRATQYTIDIIQMADMHINNSGPDIGAIAWIYDHPYDLVIENGVVMSFLWQQNFDGRMRIPYGVTRIADSVFTAAPINELHLPNTLRSIGNNAFQATNITTVVIPASVVIIGDEAFRDSERLLTVYILRRSIRYHFDGTVAGGPSIFANTNPSLQIRVPNESSQIAYSNAIHWSSHSNRIKSANSYICQNIIVWPHCYIYHIWQCFDCGDYFFERHIWHFNWNTGIATCQVCGLQTRSRTDINFELYNEEIEFFLPKSTREYDFLTNRDC